MCILHIIRSSIDRLQIKVIRAETYGYPNTVTRQEAIRLFKREMQVIASLDHPNILPVYDADEQSINGTPIMYMVMPFRQMGSLADWLHQHGNIQSPQMVDSIIIKLQRHFSKRTTRTSFTRTSSHLTYFFARAIEFGDRLDLQLADFGIAKVISLNPR